MNILELLLMFLAGLGIGCWLAARERGYCRKYHEFKEQRDIVKEELRRIHNLDN